MSALRLARAFTGRNYIVKFEGCYHGHSDGLLAKAGSGLATFGIPGSAGVPDQIAQLTLTLPYNNPSAVEAAFAAHKNEIACIIVEPVAGNMGCVPPQPGYLQALRDITAREGALLIFDEVMTGFRVADGGVQELTTIQPDLTTLGKAMANGFSLAAVTGKREFMKVGAIDEPGMERTFLLSSTHGGEMPALGAFLAAAKIGGDGAPAGTADSPIWRASVIPRLSQARPRARRVSRAAKGAKCVPV